MARTVDANILVPASRVYPGEQVVDDKNSGGLLRIVKGLNSLWEQKRGALVCDYHRSGILDATSQVARYRVRVDGGRASGATETATVELYVNFAEVTSGTAVVTITQGSNTSTWNYSGDFVGWVSASDLTIDDDLATNEYLDVTVEVTTSTDMGRVDVLGISIFYKRARTTLVAGAYDNGFVPFDDTYAAGEAPLHTPLLHQLHDAVKALYNTRLGQIVGSSYVRSPPAAATDFTFRGVVPAGVTEATVWVYLTGGAGSLTVTSPYETASPSPSAGWNEVVLTAVEDTSKLTGGERIQFTVTTETSVIESICAYWLDASMQTVG